MKSRIKEDDILPCPISLWDIGIAYHDYEVERSIPIFARRFEKEDAEEEILSIANILWQKGIRLF